MSPRIIKNIKIIVVGFLIYNFILAGIFFAVATWAEQREVVKLEETRELLEKEMPEQLKERIKKYEKEPYKLKMNGKDIYFPIKVEEFEKVFYYTKKEMRKDTRMYPESWGQDAVYYEFEDGKDAEMVYNRYLDSYVGYMNMLDSKTSIFELSNGISSKDEQNDIINKIRKDSIKGDKEIGEYFEEGYTLVEIFYDSYGNNSGMIFQPANSSFEELKK